MKARARRKPPTLAQALKRCPYQTLIGPSGAIPPGMTPQHAMDMLGPKIGAALVVLDGDPEPISVDMKADVLAALVAGQVVLLAANQRDQRDLRDYAKREILALAGPARCFG
jgi:hypothetical protein